MDTFRIEFRLELDKGSHDAVAVTVAREENDSSISFNLRSGERGSPLVALILA